MLTASVILACLAVLADAWTTRSALREGYAERNPIRRFFIRTLGLNFGTYGVAVVWSAVVVAVNVYALDTRLGLIIGNSIVAAGFGLAAWQNSRTI